MKMAMKKTKAKNVKMEMTAPCCAPDMCKPRLYLDLQDTDVKQIAGLNVGDETEFTIRGIVKGLSQRERQDCDKDGKMKTVKTGSIDLEDYTVQVVEDEKNEFTKMANDEME